MNLYPENEAGLPVIKEIESAAGLENSTALIREAFQTVADDFKLTQENSPTHPAFIRVEHLRALRENGARLFGLFIENRQRGCVVVGPLENGACTLQKLAVPPAFRHHGYGRALVLFALDFAVSTGAAVLKLDLIEENAVLKKWYQDLGFQEMDVRRFSHLPFQVCFMEYRLD